MQAFIDFMIANGPDLIAAIGAHLYMTVIAVGWAIIIGVPLGIICSYFKKLASVIMGIINITQAIPSLAILGLMIPFFGIGRTPAIIMVAVYALLPIVKNTYAGITSISPDILEASDGIGVTRFERLIYIELPMAFPVIMSGIRIAAVTAVGTMTIAAFVGGGGLGSFIFEGIGLANNSKILLGAIPAALLALLVDAVIGKIEKKMSERGPKKKVNKKKRIIQIILVVAVVLTAIFGLGKMNKRADVVVASKNYAEQILLAEIVTQMIEHHTDLTTEHKSSLGQTLFVYEALKTGDVDSYVEYSGTAYLTYLNNDLKADDTAETVMNTTIEQLASEGIIAMPQLGFENNYGFAVTQEVAEKYDMKTVSDLAKASPELRFITDTDFSAREDGFIGANKVYNFKFKSTDVTEDSIRFQALDSGQGDVINANTTEGLIKKYNLVPLEEDKSFFAPYDAFPVVRQDTLEKHPEIADVFDLLAGQIDEKQMSALNEEVVSSGKEIKDVAQAFLIEKNYFSKA